ncbi:hypothetical protein [Halosolutus gelatinilyticus]|uniref:hypothetical protein n=1 Tax=Halosolutus gelatinilyticus TaxID=2931975 RepID=UPI001FF13D64|nr:hypothetical protein [Halosolutus gelatinilyticus]
MNSHITAAVATVTVRVPLGAAGDLADGATRVIERIDAVDRLKSARVRKIAPGLNDTTVDLRVEIDLADPEANGDTALVRRELERGVGVVAVDDVESIEPEAAPLEAEVG